MERSANNSTVPSLSSILKKTLRLSTLPALTSRRTLCHWKSFNSCRQFRQRFRDGRRLAGAFVAEEVAVLQPDHLAGAEEGERLQPLAQSGRAL